MTHSHVPKPKPFAAKPLPHCLGLCGCRFEGGEYGAAGGAAEGLGGEVDWKFFFLGFAWFLQCFSSVGGFLQLLYGFCMVSYPR